MKSRWLVFWAILAVGVVGSPAFYAYQKLPLLELVDATYSMNETPGVYLVPEPEIHIPPRASAASPVQTFVVDTIQVSVPTSLVLETRRGSGTGVTIIVGPGEKMLALTPVEGYGDVVKKYRSEHSSFFENRELGSSYDFALATMHSTPNGLSVLTPWDSLVGSAVLLSFKLSETSDASAIRPISIGSLKAVQVGDPDKGDTVVRVFVFPGQYRRIDLYFREYSSAEIRSVLESLVA